MPSLGSPSQALYFQVDRSVSKYLSLYSSLQKCYDRTSFLLKTLYQSSLSQLLSSPKSRLDSLLPLFDANRSSTLILEQQEHLVEGGSKEKTPFPFLPPLLFHPEVLPPLQKLQNPNKNRYLAVFLCTIKSKEP